MSAFDRPVLCPECENPLDVFGDCLHCRRSGAPEVHQAAIAQQLDRAATHAHWRHEKYGRATVIAVSVLFSSGQALVTVRFSPFARAVVPAQVITYPAPEFYFRFEAVTP